jgi:hypothetical protein
VLLAVDRDDHRRVGPAQPPGLPQPVEGVGQPQVTHECAATGAAGQVRRLQGGCVQQRAELPGVASGEALPGAADALGHPGGARQRGRAVADLPLELPPGPGGDMQDLHPGQVGDPVGAWTGQAHRPVVHDDTGLAAVAKLRVQPTTLPVPPGHLPHRQPLPPPAGLLCREQEVAARHRHRNHLARHTRERRLQVGVAGPPELVGVTVQHPVRAVTCPRLLRHLGHPRTLVEVRPRNLHHTDPATGGGLPNNPHRQVRRAGVPDQDVVDPGGEMIVDERPNNVLLVAHTHGHHQPRRHANTPLDSTWVSRRRPQAGGPAGGGQPSGELAASGWPATTPVG